MQRFGKETFKLDLETLVQVTTNNSECNFILTQFVGLFSIPGGNSLSSHNFTEISAFAQYEILFFIRLHAKPTIHMFGKTTSDPAILQ